VREAWLRGVLDELPFCHQLRTAADLGCGAGYFSGVLQSLGFSVTVFDLQEENLRLCWARYPNVTFGKLDLDAEAPNGRYDLVLLFGILYHLQSPLQTILRLKGAIGGVAIVETRVAAGNQMACYLFNEKFGPTHNLARVTAVPTFPALVNIFKHAGFEHVYRPIYQPDHPEWRPEQNGQRHCFIVSRETANSPEIGYLGPMIGPEIPRFWTAISRV
jgi:2-polyprenyl-3-methyl-5-hydroxy-6-metoxy-1,4-benzoquinol methylase